MRNILTARRMDVGEKLVTLAAEFPEDRYDATPVPGIRSFAEHLRRLNGLVPPASRGRA
jgi:hypothetical protein